MITRYVIDIDDNGNDDVETDWIVNGINKALARFWGGGHVVRVEVNNIIYVYRQPSPT